MINMMVFTNMPHIARPWLSSSTRKLFSRVINDIPGPKGYQWYAFKNKCRLDDATTIGLPSQSNRLDFRSYLYNPQSPDWHLRNQIKHSLLAPLGFFCTRRKLLREGIWKLERALNKLSQRHKSFRILQRKYFLFKHPSKAAQILQNFAKKVLLV